MTSLRNSSRPGVPGAAAAGRSLLGQAYHPHAIEVQEFAYYGAIVDLRPQADYDEDHIAGARHVDTKAVDGATPVNGSHGLPAGVDKVLELSYADEPVLIYCGDGGRTSEPVAATLRKQDRRVDVLPGGYINYRRWVQAGLDVLPRLVSWRRLDAPPGGQRRALQALRRAGHQVLDLDELASGVEGDTDGRSVSQASFESRLVEALRRFDARSPVCVPTLSFGRLVVPAGLARAVDAAPPFASDGALAAM